MWLILRPTRPVYRPREAALANLPFTSRLSDESHPVRGVESSGVVGGYVSRPLSGSGGDEAEFGSS
jgi:hypothetical protein